MITLSIEHFMNVQNENSVNIMHSKSSIILNRHWDIKPNIEKKILYK